MRIFRTTAPVILVTTEQLEESVAFYERLFGQQSRARFKNPAGTLDLVLVGSLLLIGGSETALEARKAMKAAFVVDSLSEWQEALRHRGAVIVEEPKPGPIGKQGPVGTYMFVKHPGGTLFEYIQLLNETGTEENHVSD
jgi:hypothetical protein